MTLYLDSSAFMRIAVEEAESTALRAFLASTPAQHVSSALLRAEALRAVRQLGPEVLAVVRGGLRRIDLIGIDERILESAGMLEPWVPRTLDAIRLAMALAIGDDLDAIVTYDDRMIAAARLMGFSTASPGGS